MACWLPPIVTSNCVPKALVHHGNPPSSPVSTTRVKVLANVDDSMVVRQKGALISRDMQLYANVSIEEPDQLLFDNIPAPEPYCSETSKLSIFSFDTQLKRYTRKMGILLSRGVTLLRKSVKLIGRPSNRKTKNLQKIR